MLRIYCVKPIITLVLLEILEFCHCKNRLKIWQSTIQITFDLAMWLPFVLFNLWITLLTMTQ
ncbi:hypothetical protein [Helicobacter pullorum]|uniref:hypothetical protein n=1 Tax=Helicobacter pullorum TaxID=35818 RepID=UPI003209D781